MDSSEQRPEPTYYALGRMAEILAERLGDLDLDLQMAGDTLCVTGTVVSEAQRAEVTEILSEQMPEARIRNETALPRMNDVLPPETVG